MHVPLVPDVQNQTLIYKCISSFLYELPDHGNWKPRNTKEDEPLDLLLKCLLQRRDVLHQTSAPTPMIIKRDTVSADMIGTASFKVGYQSYLANYAPKDSAAFGSHEYKL
jgi:hypothetical protein